MLDDWFVISWRKSYNMRLFSTLPHELTSGSEFATDFSLFLTPTSTSFESSPSIRLTRKVLSHFSSLPAIRVSCRSHRNLLNLMAQTLLREQWKIRSFSLCSFHYSLLWHWCTLVLHVFVSQWRRCETVWLYLHLRYVYTILIAINVIRKYIKYITFTKRYYYYYYYCCCCCCCRIMREINRIADRQFSVKFCVWNFKIKHEKVYRRRL